MLGSPPRVRTIQPPHEVGPHLFLVDRRNPIQSVRRRLAEMTEFQAWQIQRRTRICFHGSEAKEVRDDYRIPNDPVARAHHLRDKIRLLRDPILEQSVKPLREWAVA